MNSATSCHAGRPASARTGPAARIVSSGLPWRAVRTPREGTGYVITAAAGGAGIGAGETFDDFALLSKLVRARFDSLNRGLVEPSQMLLASARPEDWANAYGTIARTAIASLAFRREHDFVMGHQHDWPVIERACNEARLPGGSLTPTPSTLTAAPGTPGWCAPCEVRYDFCPPAVIDGIVDLPTVIVPRGCLTYPVMPDFGQLYQNTGFCYPASDYDLPANPNADPVADPYWAKNKPCMAVPCPEQQTCTLDPCGVCLQSSVLLERAYGELVEYFIANALVAWGHRMNCRDLSQMIDKSTKVTVPRDQTGPGATASVLEVLEFYATWLRYKYRLGRNASIEAVLPEWLRGVLRSDLSKRMGVDLVGVTDAVIDNWLALRKIRIQWVLGLDEAFCDTTGSTTTPPSQIDPKTSLKFGGNVPALGAVGPPAITPTMWPDTVSFLVYPAGTFFRARTNLVTVESGFVDSTLLARNERLLLFMEEAASVCKRCYESLYVTVPICPSGQTGGGSISQPRCDHPGPTITLTAVTGDPTGMTFLITVDNHGNGPVTLDFGPQATPATAVNDGDGIDETIVVFDAAGTWTVTAVSAADPSEFSEVEVTVPFHETEVPPEPVVTVVGASYCDQSGMTIRVVVDNHGYGPVVVRAGQDNPLLPADTNPGDNTTPTTFVYTAPGTWMISARDMASTATGTAPVTVPATVAPQPEPDASWQYDPADPTGYTVQVTVDNNDCGPVTIDWGQTPALPEGTNPGDGTTTTSQQYTTDGVWTVTVTDADNPAAVDTMQVIIPTPPVPTFTVVEEPGDGTWRTSRATVDDPLAGATYEVTWDGGTTWQPMSTTGSPSNSATHREPTAAQTTVAVRYLQVSNVVSPTQTVPLPWPGPQFTVTPTGPYEMDILVLNEGSDVHQYRFAEVGGGGEVTPWMEMPDNPTPMFFEPGPTASKTWNLEVIDDRTGHSNSQQLTFPLM